MTDEETVLSQICALAPKDSMLQIMAVQEHACCGGRWLTCHLHSNDCNPCIRQLDMSSAVQINTYMSFAKDVLPRIRSLGYNAVQIMAVQEHAYYGSFGYHVTNFFAVSIPH